MVDNKKEMNLSINCPQLQVTVFKYCRGSRGSEFAGSMRTKLIGKMLVRNREILSNYLVDIIFNFINIK